MEVLKDNDLVLVRGGGTESTLINAFTNVFKILFEAGVGMGSSFRRFHDDDLCPVKNKCY